MSRIINSADIVLIRAEGLCILLFTGSVIRHGWAIQYVGLIFVVCKSSARNVFKNQCDSFLISMTIAVYGAKMVIGQVLFSSSRFHIGNWLNFPEDANLKAAVQRIKEEKSANASFDGRTRLEVHDLKNQGIRAFPDVLPAVLFQSNGRRVINPSSLATMRGYAPLLKPEAILWFHYEGNDIRDLDGRENNSPLLKRYLGSSFSQHLIDRQQEIDQA